MAADLDPKKHRVLLVGPRVVPLKGMFERRSYRVVAAANGVEGMAQLDTDPCDLVILELNLGDLTATEFLMAARQGSPRATFLLVDEAGRAGQIVKALQAGLDGFLAAPADEDRLFYEVERHLRRVGAPAPEPAADHDASGFEENSTQTQMTTVEATRAAAEGRDAQALLEKATEAMGTLRADNERLAAESRRLAEVQGVLQGQLEGHLDANEAMRLRERLGLAQVAEIELLTLRGDVQSMKASRKEQDQRIEELQRELRLARAAIEAASIAATATGGFAEPPPTDMGRAAELEARLADLEQDVVRWERRNRDLEATLTAAKQALSNAEEESETAVLEVKAAARADLDAVRADKERLDEQVGLLQAELARVGTVDASLSEARAELERVRASLVAAEAAASLAVARAAEDDIRQSAATEDAIAIAVDAERARLEERFAAERTQAVAAERARLEREQTSALEVAMSAASSAAADKARAALDKAIAAERAAAAEREKAAVAAAEASTRAAVRHEIEAAAAKKIADAVDQARASRERADDIELQLEEARTRVEFLEMDAARVNQEADARVAAAEATFKREKVRLVEEKQAAASGSQEAILRMDALRDEAVAARQLAEEAEAARADATATAAAAVLAREDAEGELRGLRDDRDRERDRARAALDTVERLEAAFGALQGHARDLEARVTAAEAAAEEADSRAAAAVEAGQTAAAEVEERAATLARSAREHIEAEAIARIEAEVARVRAEAAAAVAAASDAARQEAEDRVARATEALRVEAEARVAAEVEAARVAAEARVAAAADEARAAAEARVTAAREAAAAEAAAAAAEAAAAMELMRGEAERQLASAVAAAVAEAERQAFGQLETTRTEAEARLRAALDEVAASARIELADSEARHVAEVARLEEELLDVKARAAVDADNAGRVTEKLAAAEERSRAAVADVTERDETLAIAIAGLAEARQAAHDAAAALATARQGLAEKDAALARAAHALEAERMKHGAEQARLEAALEAARTAAVAQANASDAAEALAAARIDADARVAAAEQERAAIERRLGIAETARATAEHALTDAGRQRADLEKSLADVEKRLADAVAAAARQGASGAGDAEKLAAALQRLAAAEAARAAAEQKAVALEQGAGAQVAAAEAARAAAVADIARVQAEASIAHEQALQAVGELQEQLNTLEEERGGWQAEKARLTSQVIGLQERVAKAAQVNGQAHDAEVAGLAQRVAELEGQLSQVDPGMVATVRSLVDAVDPLRWGLGAAIDYLYPFEGNDQSLATHVRNLRLLSATLARLVAETGARPGTG